METVITRIEEDRLDKPSQQAVALLLETCFPEMFDGRIYFKQLPSFRYLAREGETLMGHLAIDHRVVRLGDEPARIFGLVDMCVHEAARRRGMGARLIQKAEQEGRHAGAEFMILFADDHRLYQREGFARASNVTTWLAIDAHASLDMKNEPLADCLMVKSLGDRAWNNDVSLDMLGHVF